MKTLEKNEETNSNLIHALSNEIIRTHFVCEIERFFNQYQHFAVKTAKSTIEMCRVVHEAKQQLNKDDFSQFCASIAHKPEDSTIRKYLAIGERYQQLIDCAALLPNSWTSIYLITQIPAETFNALVATSSDMSSFTGKDIQKLIDGSKASSAATAAATVAATAAATVAATAATAAAAAAAAAAADAATAAATAATAAATDAATDAASKQTSSSKDRDAYAKKATDQMINHVSSRISSNNFDDDNDDQSAYAVIIRFSNVPSDDAVNEVVDLLFSIRAKYKLKFEVNAYTGEHE